MTPERPQMGPGQRQAAMSEIEPRKRHTADQVIGGLLGGAVLGAAGGAALGGSFDWPGAALGAAIGAAVFGPAEAITTLTTTPGKLKPLPYRILTSALAVSIFGWLLELIFGVGEPLVFGIVIGVGLGLLGMRPAKLALGGLSAAESA